jgi:hypothetical protein
VKLLKQDGLNKDVKLPSEGNKNACGNEFVKRVNLFSGQRCHNSGQLWQAEARQEVRCVRRRYVRVQMIFPTVSTLTLT